jgi:hypothetical protein
MPCKIKCEATHCTHNDLDHCTNPESIEIYCTSFIEKNDTLHLRCGFLDESFTKNKEEG